jgi:hypothetical protein
MTYDVERNEPPEGVDDKVDQTVDSKAGGHEVSSL